MDWFSLAVRGTNSVGPSRGVLVFTVPPRGVREGVPKVVASLATTRSGGEVEVYWLLEPGVEELHVIWGAGHPVLLQVQE